MKTLIPIFISFICAISVSAQYYNPYNNPYANQQAFEWGIRMAEQMQQQQDAQDARSVTGCFNRIGKAIARRNFSEAEDWAEKLLDLRKDHGYYYLGLINELEGNGSYAESCYQEGVSNRSKACQKELDRISIYGYASDEQIDNVVGYFQQLEAMSYNMAAQIANDIWGNSSGSATNRSNRNSGSCPKCHGSGIDPFPMALGDPYTGANISAQGLVGYTHTSGNRCTYCGKYEYHIHYKCQSSTYHSH